MPGAQRSADQLLANVRKKHWVGRFSINVAQTATHPDQRPLDDAWVEELSSKIGSKSNLNRALYPIGVILTTDSYVDELRILAVQAGDEVPDLPSHHKVLVFAGQHRLAVLPRLDLEQQEDLWWHADVYAACLQTEQPAEFLTMMHESNVPTIMKASSDVDLFHAIVKLKAFLETGVVEKPAFLLNRQALLGHNVVTSRAICTLTRNNQLADAVSEALSRTHIAKIFNAGAWIRIGTGRLWGVASGILREMICQVDLLTRGVVDVPEDVLTLRPRSCQFTHLESHLNRKKNQGHPWDVLPGKLGGALERVRNRPVDFVTPLNPKTGDGWSFPDMVLLPSCIGSGIVEEQLKTTQTVMMHLLRACAEPTHFNAYIHRSGESMEVKTDHPAGMIAHVLAAQRKDISKVLGYEQKIIHFVWTNRAVLAQALNKVNIGEPLSAEADDYLRLISESQHWWQLLRMFKTHRFPFGWRLAVPKEFGSPVNHDSQNSTQLSAATDEVMNQNITHTLAQDEETALLQSTSSSSNKRPRTEPPVDGDEASSHSAGRAGSSNLEGGAEGIEHSTHSKDVGDGGRSRPKKRLKPLSPEVLPEDTDEETDRPGDQSAGPLPPRIGGDRQLGRTLARVESLAKTLTRPESQGISTLLNHVLRANQKRRLSEVLSQLNEQASLLLDPDSSAEAGTSTPPNVQEGSDAGTDDDDSISGDDH